MSTLSQFFQSPGTLAIGSGKVRFFSSSGTVTVPSNVTYMAYGVLGGGGGGMFACFPAVGECHGAYSGGGGGFSWWDGPVTCANPFSVCATVASTPSCTLIAGPGFSPTPTDSKGGTSCITGVTTPIYATGGDHHFSCCCQVPSSFGCGVGGLINTCGGCGVTAVGSSVSNLWGAAGGGGAGGLLGNGGCGGCGGGTNPQASVGGGGGYGSGGGGGASGSCSGTGLGGWGGAMAQPGGVSPGIGVSGAPGGNGIMGRGAYVFGNGGGTPVTLVTSFQPGEEGFMMGYTENAKFSQAKTFLGASGGGGAGGYSCWYHTGAGNAGSGGGGSAINSIAYGTTRASAGFGGGSSGTSQIPANYPTAGLGGGAGIGNSPSFAAAPGGYAGRGFAIVEYWD